MQNIPTLYEYNDFYPVGVALVEGHISDGSSSLLQALSDLA